MNIRPSTDFWAVLRDRLKEQHPELTNEDLSCSKGHETEMLWRIEQKLHKTPLEMAVLLDEIVHDRQLQPDGATGERYLNP